MASSSGMRNAHCRLFPRVCWEGNRLRLRETRERGETMAQELIVLRLSKTNNWNGALIGVKHVRLRFTDVTGMRLRCVPARG